MVFIGRAVLALYDCADEIRCEIVGVEGMGDLIKGHDMSDPDVAAKQECERGGPAYAKFHEGISAVAG
eukprot:1140950-Pelagomonas_calceolata.AAC.1